MDLPIEKKSIDNHQNCQ